MEPFQVSADQQGVPLVRKNHRGRAWAWHTRKGERNRRCAQKVSYLEQPPNGAPQTLPPHTR